MHGYDPLQRITITSKLHIAKGQSNGSLYENDSPIEYYLLNINTELLAMNPLSRIDHREVVRARM